MNDKYYFIMMVIGAILFGTAFYFKPGIVDAIFGLIGTFFFFYGFLKWLTPPNTKSDTEVKK